jgi:hypothetical protein
MIDVVNKRCLHEGCSTQPKFNFEGEKQALYCSAHKLEGMIDVVSKRCLHEGCSTIPCCNFEGKKALYCSAHKLEGMIDVVNKRCIMQHCDTFVTDKYDGYCSWCFSHLFPEDKRTLQIRKKTKEIAVRDYINAHFEGFQHDIPIRYGGCDCAHRRRVDHRRRINGTMLAIETDEHQHKGYDDNDEENRYNDLFMAHSGKWIMIRFNPDSYTCASGKARKTPIATRLQTLSKEINKQINRIENNELNEELMEVVKLYYDGYSLAST